MTVINQQRFFANIVLAIGFLLQIGLASAQEGEWRVRKTSGDAWVGQSQAQQVSLSDSSTLKPGDSIRTGRTGRVLLSRGEETILIAPNSAITLPPRQEGGMRTVIIQQAGNILIQAEKRDVRHFQVETPYLAAVVKGTRFNVSVNGRGANVNVMQGRVEVSDFKTGQIALVLPGQAANVLSNGTGGLKLRGSGTFNPIAQGTPRTTPVRPVPVPRDGFQGPAPQTGREAAVQQRLATTGASQGANQQLIQRGPNNSLRITAPLGEVKVNINKASDGLANATLPAVDQRGNNREKTIWNANSTGGASSSSTPTLLTSNRGNGNSASSNSGSAVTSAVNSAVSASSGSGVSGSTEAVSSTVSSTVASTTSTTVNSVNKGTGSVDSDVSGKTNALTKGNGLKLGLTK